MSRIITALFDTRADAEAGAERLRQAGIDAGHVSVHDHGTHDHGAHDHGTHDHASTGTSSDTGKVPANSVGIWDTIKNAVVPHADRHTYDEGLRRGGFLLTAQVADEKTAAAVAALNEANTIDLDARAEEWRADGWDYADDTAYADDAATAIGSRDTEFGSSRYRAYRTEGF